ncbi:hypothetical protein ACJX0J_033999, partial [Zea mays]
ITIITYHAINAAMQLANRDYRVVKVINRQQYPYSISEACVQHLGLHVLIFNGGVTHHKDKGINKNTLADSTHKHSFNIFLKNMMLKGTKWQKRSPLQMGK